MQYPIPHFFESSFLIGISVNMNDIEYEKIIWGLSGIYMWTSPSKKKYVGLSDNLGSRHKDFRCASVNRPYVSENSIIDKARQKYPYDQWQYEIIELCSIPELGSKETYWIDKIKPEYNITKGGIGGNGVPKTAFKVGHKNTEEQKIKQRETLKRHIEEGSVSYDFRGLRIAVYDLDGNFIKDFPTIKKAEKWCGVRLSWVIKYPDSQHAAGKKYMVRTGNQFEEFPQTIEPYQKIKRTFSEEAKLHMSNAAKGNKKPGKWTPVVAIYKNGEFFERFDSVDIAAEFIHPDNPDSAAKNISRVINGKGGFDKNGKYHVKKSAYKFIWKKESDYKNLEIVSNGVSQVS